MQRKNKQNASKARKFVPIAELDAENTAAGELVKDEFGTATLDDYHFTWNQS